jgi:hypothetical protein
MRTHPRRKGVLALVVAAALLAAGGIAYAAIPDGGGVYTACMLKNVGTIRLIDPSGPSGSLLSHCTSFETQIQWNQKGQKGDAGANGVSPTVVQLSAGDSHCPAGGAAITDANGSTAYVCNGQDGQNGKDFAGTFTSQNGQFSLSVDNGGVEIVGPDASIGIDSSGNVSIKGGNVETVAAGNETLTVGGNRTESVGGDEKVTIGGNRTESVAGDDKITVSGDRSQKITGNDTITVSGNRSEKVALNDSVEVDGALELKAADLRLDAAFLGLDAGAACKPVARVGDLVDSVSILTGSPDVCID